MAQSAVASMPNGTAMGLTEEQRLELEEYEKIVRFRNVVFSGTHPRIKLLPHMAPQPLRATPSSTTAQPPQSRPTVAAPASVVATTTSKEIPAATQSARQDGGKTYEQAEESIPGTGKTNNPDINPIFLEKGPALVKAEMKLRREKIERALKEQAEKQRTAAKAASQPGVEDEVPDFDVNEVLAKAIAIARAKPLIGEKQAPAVSGGAPSDSFDDNTFYSSSICTAEHSTSSRARRESGEVSTGSTVPFKPAPTGISQSAHKSSQLAHASSSASVVPGLQELDRVQPRSAHDPKDQHRFLPAKTGDGPSHSRLQQANTSRESFYNNDFRKDQAALPPTSRAGISKALNVQSVESLARENSTLPTRMDVDPVQSPREPLNQGTKPPANANPPRHMSIEEPGDIRNFNLSPVAPQPVRVSPLARAKVPPFAQQNFDLDGSQTYTPLQGRQDNSTGGSSSQGKQAETQRGKRKLSSGKSGPRSNGAGPSRPVSPYIKPEPRSPSPFNPAPLPRPHKRQRQIIQDNGGLDYDEPRQEEARPLPQQPKQRQARQGNARRFPRQSDGSNDVVEIDEPQPRDLQQRRMISRDLHAIPQSPRTHVIPYSPHDQRVERIVRPVSRMVIDPYAPSPSYQATPAPRSARPVEVLRDGSVSPAFQEIRSPIMMAPPPRMAERRLVMDEYGRQYYASIPVVPRQSMVQQSRVVDQDYIFDRPVIHMARPAQHVYEEDGVFYKREPAYPPRRVITVEDEQLVGPSYPHREFSVRPMPVRQAFDNRAEEEPIQVVRPREFSRRPSVARAPVDDIVRVGEDEYVRVMPPPQRREMSHFEPQPQIVRIGSVRPEQRYGASVREYVTSRPPSIHPEAQTPVRGEFAASVRAEERDGETIVRTREYSVRPADGMGPPRREYMQPMEAYQPVRRIVRSNNEDVEYVSRQQPMRQVTRRPEEEGRYVQAGELHQEDFDGQPQYPARRQAQQEIYDDEPHHVVYR